MSMERDQFSRYIYSGFFHITSGMKLLWGVSLSPKLSSQQTPIWSIPSKSSRQIVVHLGAPLSHQHWKVKFTKDPCTSKKPDPGTLPWYKSYSLYAVCSILEFEKGHLKKISYAPFQLFPKKIWQKRFFLVVGGKDIYIYIYTSKKHLNDQIAQQHFCGANLALNLSLPLKLGSQLQTLGKVGWPRVSAAGPGWRAAPGSGGGWELYSMRQGTWRVGCSGDVNHKCHGNGTRWYQKWTSKMKLPFFLGLHKIFC